MYFFVFKEFHAQAGSTFWWPPQSHITAIGELDPSRSIVCFKKTYIINLWADLINTQSKLTADLSDKQWSKIDSI